MEKLRVQLAVCHFFFPSFLLFSFSFFSFLCGQTARGVAVCLSLFSFSSPPFSFFSLFFLSLSFLCAEATQVPLLLLCVFFRSKIDYLVFDVW